MKAFFRLCIGAALPPLIGSILFIIYGVLIGAPFGEPNVLFNILLILGYAYIFMGWQSIFYSVVMEFFVLYNTTNKFIVLPISCGLGLLTAMTVFVFGDIFLKVWPLMLVIGSITGLLVGFILLKLAPTRELF